MVDSQLNGKKSVDAICEEQQTSPATFYNLTTSNFGFLHTLFMKSFNLIVFCALLTPVLQAQDTRNRCGDVFDGTKYPSDSFSVRERVYPLGNTSIVIYSLRHDYFKQGNFIQVWFEQRKDGKTWKSKYWGYPEGENDLNLLNEQPLNDYYIINDARETTGIFYVISKTGVWYELPGGYIALNEKKSMLFTYVPVECGGCLIGRFNLKSQKLSTKLWDGYGTTWRKNGNQSNFLSLKSIFAEYRRQ